MSSTRWRGISPALMFVGLLVLFGHDLVMAADPHAPAGAYAGHVETLERTDTDCGALDGSPPASHTVPDLPRAVASPLVPVGVPDPSQAAWRIEPGRPRTSFGPSCRCI